MNGEICCITNKRKQLKINGIMMTLPLYSAYKKIRTIRFPYLPVDLLKQSYISSVKSYKYINKLIS